MVSETLPSACYILSDERLYHIAAIETISNMCETSAHALDCASANLASQDFTYVFMNTNNNVKSVVNLI